jgi:hypothetical protein
VKTLGDVDALAGKFFGHAIGSVYATFDEVVHIIGAVKRRCWCQGNY